MFSTLQEFKQAALEVRNLAKTPSNEEFAMLYSLYKQATDGDCNRGKFTGGCIAVTLGLNGWVVNKHWTLTSVLVGLNPTYFLM